MSAKTVMHLIATSFYGGPEKQIVEHLKRLDQTKYKGIAASFIEGEQGNEFIDRAKGAGVKVQSLHMSSPLDFIALWKLIRLLKSCEVDLLCTHGYKSAVMGWIASKINGNPVVAFSRGYTGENRKVAFYEWLDRKFISISAGIICVSEGQRKKLKKLGLNVNEQNSWVVHNAALLDNSPASESGDREKFCEEIGIDPDAIIAVAAGRLSPEKGHRFLVKAMADLKERDVNLICLICGDGMEMESLREQAKSLGVDDCCLFLGFRRDVPQIFKIMDFMVLPSLTEGLPNVILESFALSKPVISTCVGGVPEIVEQNVNGIMVDAEDSGSLATAMEGLAKDKNLREIMGQKGHHDVCSKFTFEKQAKELQDIYASLMFN